MKLSDFAPNPKNPRKITDAQLQDLKKSMEEFGDISGFFYNVRTKRLGGGHQRGKVLPKDAEVTLTNTYEKPTKTGTIAEGYVLANGEKYSFRKVDWDEERELAANIAANKHGGSWDEELLAETLNKLEQQMRELTGFSDEAVKELLGKLEKETEGLTDPDSLPETPKVAKSKHGELWLLGNHRMLCGDATNAEDVARLMEGEKADMVFTDPPYGIDLDEDRNLNVKGSAFSKRIGLTVHTHSKIANDDKPFDAGHIFKFFENANELFVWGANNFVETIPGCSKGSWIVWERVNSEAMERMLGSHFELCWSRDRHKYAIARIPWKGVAGHHKVDDGSGKVHPSQKPVKLAEWFFDRWGKRSKLIWDGYLGSGSTLIACEKTKRRCFGMEIEPLYVDVILERWAKFTGKEPKREDGTPWSYIRDGGD